MTGRVGWVCDLYIIRYSEWYSDRMRGRVNVRCLCKILYSRSLSDYKFNLTQTLILDVHPDHVQNRIPVRYILV